MANVWQMHGKCMVNVWQMYGKCMVNVWQMYGKWMVNVWQLHGKQWCMSNVCQMYVKCMSNVCRMYVKCVANVWQVYAVGNTLVVTVIFSAAHNTHKVYLPTTIIQTKRSLYLLRTNLAEYPRQNPELLPYQCFWPKKITKQICTPWTLAIFLQ